MCLSHAIVFMGIESNQAKRHFNTNGARSNLENT